MVWVEGPLTQQHQTEWAGLGGAGFGEIPQWCTTSVVKGVADLPVASPQKVSRRCGKVGACRLPEVVFQKLFGDPPVFLGLRWLTRTTTASGAREGRVQTTKKNPKDK